MTRNDPHEAEFALSRAIDFANEGTRYWAVRWFRYAIESAVTDEQRARFARFAAAYNA